MFDLFVMVDGKSSVLKCFLINRIFRVTLRVRDDPKGIELLTAPIPESDLFSISFSRVFVGFSLESKVAWELPGFRYLLFLDGPVLLLWFKDELGLQDFLLT